MPSYNLYITADDRQWPLVPTVVSNSTSAAVPRGERSCRVKRPSFFPKRTSEDSEDSVVFEGLEVVLLDKFFLEMFVVGGLFMFPIFRTSNGLGFSILELSCTH